jgi:hypothetical protein
MKVNVLKNPSHFWLHTVGKLAARKPQKKQTQKHTHFFSFLPFWKKISQTG